MMMKSFRYGLVQALKIAGNNVAEYFSVFININGVNTFRSIFKEM